MHEAAADDDLQLYLFPTDDSGLPDHNRSFGAFDGRFSGLIAWNQNPRGFFLYCGICDGHTDRQAGSQTYNMAKNLLTITLLQTVRRRPVLQKSILGQVAPSMLARSSIPNPWLKALDPQISRESRIHP